MQAHEHITCILFKWRTHHSNNVTSRS